MLFLLSTLATAIPGLSNGVFCVLNGLLYGPWLGSLINWLADSCGQVILLVGVKFLLRNRKRGSKLFKKLTNSGANPYFNLFLGYMIPIIPSVTVAFANLQLLPTFKKRLIPIFTGVLPAAFLYAFGGDALLHLDWHRLVVFAGCFLVLLLLDLLFTRTKKAAKNAAPHP